MQHFLSKEERLSQNPRILKSPTRVEIMTLWIHPLFPLNEKRQTLPNHRKNQPDRGETRLFCEVRAERSLEGEGFSKGFFLVLGEDFSRVVWRVPRKLGFGNDYFTFQRHRIVVTSVILSGFFVIGQFFGTKLEFPRCTVERFSETSRMEVPQNAKPQKGHEPNETMETGPWQQPV